MTTLCHIDDIADEQSKGFNVDNDTFFAVKKGGQIYLYRNSCPHLGVELNWQQDKFLDMDGMLIQCSTHGALFLIEDGECVSGPCQGQQLQAVAFEIIDGQISLST
ncbi:Rieske (2Fe-2S) protein [Oceanicoccus sagamiensis]|uniref:(2Fe-2S)-binding protein n=1 Tax=Oceanicoccus sagamiensis TaxID=716816 RepID=A0A1X9NDH2_9GAMM|nr:Rieske (2Fe-2S) protein [Oceanicoccus sagamiensis]ARN72997.1 (2Fe-2S)-binding protein [Oceanicoccus sagamiensis]